MKKLYSLIKACMTNDMSLFKVKNKKNKKSNIILFAFIALWLMFTIWANAQVLFEKMAPMKLQTLLLSLAVFAISIMTIIEGIYKTGSLIFNCKDDQLLLSLPIKRRTVLFVRIFKFYVFELMFNSIFIIPFMVAYVGWATNIIWTFYLTSAIMLLLLPIIPIVISCIIGALVSSLSSRFKYKNAAQIIISVLFLLGFFYLSMNMEDFYNYIVVHATSINDLITKIYYPAGMYATLVTDFSVIDLLIFIVVNLAIFAISIFILSKVYFKINSRLKKVATTKKTNVDKLTIKSTSQTKSLMKKEINTFVKTPVFIINAGFALVLFLIGAVIAAIKFDGFVGLLNDPNGINIPKDLIMNNLAVFILIFLIVTSFMTSITNSVISLEGKNINILKSLPISSKKILMSKIHAALLITTPILLIGDLILCISFKVNIIESLLILVLSILIPLVSHFIGLLVNLRFPKLDAENSTEVVKQSVSSFISVMLGMILLIINIAIIINVIEKLNSTLILLAAVIIYLIIDGLLYLYLIKKGTKKFDKLTI